MPKTTDNSEYAKYACDICDNEKKLIGGMKALIFGQHILETNILKDMAEKAEAAADAEGIDLEDFPVHVFEHHAESLEQDITGGVATILCLAELYRVMVDQGKIKPLDLRKMAPGLSLTSSNLDSIGEAADEGINAIFKGVGKEFCDGKELSIAFYEEKLKDAPNMDDIDKTVADIIEKALGDGND